MDEIEKLLKYNEYFVDNKLYERYETTKLPNKKLAIVTCMDTRLTKILYKSLDIKNGDAKIIKNAGGIITSETDDVMRSLVVATNFLNVDKIMIISHEDCGMCNIEGELLFDKYDSDILESFMSKNNIKKIDDWIKGFNLEQNAVQNSMRIVKKHPLISDEILVRGFVINPATGQLKEVCYKD